MGKKEDAKEWLEIRNRFPPSDNDCHECDGSDCEHPKMKVQIHGVDSEKVHQYCYNCLTWHVYLFGGQCIKSFAFISEEEKEKCLKRLGMI